MDGRIKSGHGVLGKGGKNLTGANPIDLPSFDIAGQVALVTGASSGIGEHFAQVLAAAGAKVALAARRADRLAAVARDIAAQGGECLPLACDVTQRDSIAAALAAAEDLDRQDPEIRAARTGQGNPVVSARN